MIITRHWFLLEFQLCRAEVALDRLTPKEFNINSLRRVEFDDRAIYYADSHPTRKIWTLTSSAENHGFFLCLLLIVATLYHRF